jgi:acyl carrier protein
MERQNMTAVVNGGMCAQDHILGMIARLSGRPFLHVLMGHKLATDLGLDSLDRIELLMDIEEAYDIELKDFARDATVKEVLLIVNGQLRTTL